MDLGSTWLGFWWLLAGPLQVWPIMETWHLGDDLRQQTSCQTLELSPQSTDKCPFAYALVGSKELSISGECHFPHPAL